MIQDSSREATCRRQPPDRLTVKGELTISTSSDLCARFSERLDAGQDLVVDLHEVDSCDAAGIQLLCSVLRTARERTLSVRLEPAGGIIWETAASLGVRLDEAVPGHGAADGV